jgi:lipid-A-disaccharide synthase-like uncharacterized protein
VFSWAGLQWFIDVLRSERFHGALGRQLMFTGRFIVQWLASEKAGRSVVPVAFWYFSIIGGFIVLLYGIHKVDPVIILGQLPGVLIYSRNLWLIYKARREQAL